jgi:hypothetical protein
LFIHVIDRLFVGNRCSDLLSHRRFTRTRRKREEKKNSAKIEKEKEKEKERNSLFLKFVSSMSVLC